MLVREMFAGHFCTTVLGGCSTADADTNGTVSTLRLLMHAGRLTTRVRPTPSRALQQLRVLEQHVSLERQQRLQRRSPLLRAHVMRVEASEYARATGGADSPKLNEGLLSQLELVLRLRNEQTQVLHAWKESVQQMLAVTDKAPQGAAFEDIAEPRGCSANGAVPMDLKQIDQLLQVLNGWNQEAQDALANVRLSTDLICASPTPPMREEAYDGVLPIAVAPGVRLQ